MRRRVNNLCVMVSFVILVVSSGHLAAQVTQGSIVGFVRDQSGAFIPGVQVEATNSETNLVRTVFTNDVGSYAFLSLPPGPYQLSVEMQGFQRATTGEIVLHTGSSPRIDFELTVGTATESVEVVGAVPLIKTTTTDLGVVVGSKEVKELPLNGRDFTQLLNLQAGVGIERPFRGGVNINGVYSLANNYLLDGIDTSFGENNGVGIGSAGGRASAGAGSAVGVQINTVSIEALEEFKVTSGAFSAEYGRSLGGVVNLRTKSGTNDFHGTAFYFFRDEALDAANFFENRRGAEKGELDWSQYGGNIGGPIVADKAFFFFNYEGAKIAAPSQVTGNVPSEFLLDQITNPQLHEFLNGLPKQNNTPTSSPFLDFHSRTESLEDDENTFLGRVDLNLGSHAISGRYSHNNQQFQQPTGPRVGAFTAFPIRYRNLSIADVTVISPTIINEVRFGVNYNQIDRGPPDGRHVLGSPNSIGWIFGAGLAQTDSQGGIKFETTTYTILDNFTWVSGNHTLKTGFEARLIDSIRLQSQQPFHRYGTPQDLIDDEYLGVEVVFGNPGEGYEGYWNYAGYIQDNWKISPRVQLNMGLRYEYYTVFKGSIGIATDDIFGARNVKGDPIWQPDKNNFGPRLGLVLDVTGTGKTMLRAGGGISYIAPQPFDYFDMTWVDERLPFAPFLRPVDLGDDPSLNVPHFPLPVEFIQAVFDDPDLLPGDFRISYSTPPQSRRDPYAGSWNLSLQHAVTPNFAVEAAYVGNQLNKLVLKRQVNRLDPDTGERLRPDLGGVSIIENGSRSHYHALQLSAKKRMVSSYGFDAYYTWAKALDFPFGLFQSTIQDPNDIAASSGEGGTLGSGAVPHRFTLVNFFELPTPGFAKDSAFGRGLLGNWNVQGILNTRVGQAVNVRIGRDVTGDGERNDRPDVTGTDPRVNGSDPTVWFTRAGFDEEGPISEQRFGNLGYNANRGPGAFTWDVAIHKLFYINDQHRIQFRFEMFNWMNHTVFGNPQTNMGSGTFGQITRTLHNSRNIQLAVKYLF